MNLSELVRNLRESRGLTVRELAAEAGLGHAVVNKLECGQRVKGPTLTKILAGLGLKRGSPEHSRALALWAGERTGGGGALRERVLAKVATLNEEQLRKLQAWLRERR